MWTSNFFIPCSHGDASVVYLYVAVYLKNVTLGGILLLETVFSQIQNIAWQT